MLTLGPARREHGIRLFWSDSKHGSWWAFSLLVGSESVRLGITKTSQERKNTTSKGCYVWDKGLALRCTANSAMKVLRPEAGFAYSVLARSPTFSALVLRILALRASLANSVRRLLALSYLTRPESARCATLQCGMSWIMRRAGVGSYKAQ